MSGSGSSFSRINRSALIIFSALALTFIAQLVWWVIFQFALIEKRYDDYLAFAEARQLELVARFEPELTFARSLLTPPDTTSGREWLFHIQSAVMQSALLESVVYLDQAGSPLYVGQPTARSHLQSGPEGRAVVNVDFTVIDSAARAGNPKLTFVAPEKITTELSVANFPLDSAQAAEYLDERETSIRMHLAEGGFFVALIFAGLALIYRALARSEESRRMQENFLMAVTHELKTPLASLKLSLQGLRRGKFDAERTEKANQMINTDIDRLDSLITDLLDAGKNVRERTTRPQALDLRAFVRDYFDQRGKEFSQRKVSLSLFAETTEQGLNSPTVLISGEDLKRALDVVVDNAIKFCGENPQLTVELRKKSRNVELCVSDNGIGIDSDEVSRIFERFYRVGSELTRSRPGVGLGLYLGRQILRSYGGDLRAESSGVDQGSTFTLSLPSAEKTS